MESIHVKINELEHKLADLQARLPAHSVPPSMIIEMEELEEQLAELYARAHPPQADEGATAHPPAGSKGPEA